MFLEALSVSAHNVHSAVCFLCVLQGKCHKTMQVSQLSLSQRPQSVLLKWFRLATANVAEWMAAQSEGEC